MIPSSARSIAAMAILRAASGSFAQPRLVQLDHAGAGRLQRVRLAVDRRRQVHHQLVGIGVGLVGRLLGHRERARERDLRRQVGVSAQELQVAHLDRPTPADRAGDPRHRPRLARARGDRGRSVGVDALERGGEGVGVALPANLAVGDHVDPGKFHVADGHAGGVVLGLGEERLSHSPGVAHTHARNETSAERGAVDQPVRLGIAADDGGCEHCPEIIPGAAAAFNRPRVLQRSSAIRRFSKCRGG